MKLAKNGRIIGRDEERVWKLNMISVKSSMALDLQVRIGCSKCWCSSVVGTSEISLQPVLACESQTGLTVRNCVSWLLNTAINVA